MDLREVEHIDLADHEMYHVPGITDLDKMRDEAARNAAGNELYNEKSESTIIHHHRYNEPCGGLDSGHEVFGVLDA